MDKQERRLALEEHNQRAAQQRADFINVFTSDAGRRILDALREEYYDCRIEPGPDAEYKLGQRSVIQEILERVNERD